MTPKLPLRWRLNFTFAALIALLLVLDLGITAFGARRRIDPEIASAQELAVDVLRDEVAALPAGVDGQARLAALAARFDRWRHIRVSFAPAESAGAVPGPTHGPPTRAAPQWFAALFPTRIARATIPAATAGKPLGTLIVEGDPADEIDELWESFAELAIDGGMSAAFGFVIVYLVVNAALRPLDRLNAGLAALSRGDFGARLERPVAPEFAPLLARFNTLGESLAAAARENQSLRARLVSIQDAERKEIGRELHDEIGPHLFAARAQAGAARRTLPHGASTEALDSLVDLIDALQATNRRILDRLRPAALEELGLGPALGALARLFERSRPGLQVHVAAAPAPPLETGLETALYRIAQEALTNAARHAGASRVDVVLNFDDDGANLGITDNGRGLDARHSPGLGLIGMRERAAAYGGVLTLGRTEAGGLSVSARFPLAAAPDNPPPS